MQLLLAEVAKHGSQKAFAEHLGISDAYLSDMLTGRREFAERALREIGLERRSVFVRRDASELDVIQEVTG